MSLDHQKLLEIWRAEKPLSVPYFDGMEVELLFDDEEHLREMSDDILSFLTLTADNRRKDAHHAYAYFRDFVDEAGFEWAEDGMEKVAEESDDIWKFVYPTVLTGSRSWDAGNENAERGYIELEANCGWEKEHGLQMSWRDGSELVKLSAYDGHATNGHAYDDLSKDAFVYVAMDSRWNTANLSHKNQSRT